MFAPVFAALAIFVALAESPSPPPPPTPRPEAEQHHREGDGDKRESTPVAKPVVAPTQNAGEDKQQRDNRNNKSSPDRTFKFNWALLFTGVIAFGALVQAVAVFVQGRITRAQLRATQKSADAAMQSAQNIRTLNRAKLVVEPLIFDDVKDDTKETFRYSYRVTNTGKTTAHVFECFETARVVDDPLPDGPPALEGIAPTAKNIYLAPKEHATFNAWGFSKAGLDTTKFAEEKSELYAFGVVKYWDDFGYECRTEYAWQYRRTGPAFFVQQTGYNRRT